MHNRINGKKVLIRKLKLRDKDDIYNAINDRDIIKWLTNVPWPYKPGYAEGHIRRSIAGWRTKKRFQFGICLENDRVIGMVGLSKIDYQNKMAVLGYWLSKKYWNMGIMSEALNLVEKFAFRELKLHRLHAEVYSENASSARVLMKAGFKHEGTLRDKLRIKGRYQNVCIYGKLAGGVK